MSLKESFAYDQGMHRINGIQAGNDLEAGLFGVAIIPKAERVDEKISFDAALAYARKHQPDQLRRSPVLSKLRNAVAMFSDNVRTPVRFFTAVGTPLDYQHGIDGWFEQDGVIVTLDVSMREKESLKADVLLVASMDEDGKIHIDERELLAAAKKIGDLLNRRMQGIAA